MKLIRKFFSQHFSKIQNYYLLRRKTIRHKAVRSNTVNFGKLRKFFIKIYKSQEVLVEKISQAFLFFKLTI